MREWVCACVCVCVRECVCVLVDKIESERLTTRMTPRSCFSSSAHQINTNNRFISHSLGLIPGAKTAWNIWIRAREWNRKWVRGRERTSANEKEWVCVCVWDKVWVCAWVRVRETMWLREREREYEWAIVRVRERAKQWGETDRESKIKLDDCDLLVELLFP